MNISAISWLPFLVVEEAGVPGETIIYASVFTVKFNK
jgi:hypothetical protein